MSFNFQSIIDSYIDWIRDNSSIKIIADDNICEITTPFLDRHNDHLQIYVKKNQNTFFLTDDGYTLNDLKLSGVELDTPKRDKIFKTMLNGYGVKVGEKNELYAEAVLANIGQKKHNLLQAILSVNDLYTLSTENILSLFKEDVERYFLANEIFYSKDIKITGKSGFDHNIDFIISATRSKPERLIRAINNPKKDTVLSAIMAFNDIQAIREQKTNNIIIYNDMVNPPIPEVINALKSYQIIDLAWSKREEYMSEFLPN